MMKYAKMLSLGESALLSPSRSSCAFSSSLSKWTGPVVHVHLVLVCLRGGCDGGARRKAD